MEGLHRIIDRCGEHQAQQEIDDVDGDYHWLTAKIGRLGLIILFRLTSAISEMQAVFMDVLLPKLRLKVIQHKPFLFFFSLRYKLRFPLGVPRPRLE